MKSRFGIIILFFVIAIVRKWGGEEVGMNFSFPLALAGGLGSYLIVITIFGNYKVALIIGLVAGIVLGYGAGLFGFGEESDGGYG